MASTIRLIGARKTQCHTAGQPAVGIVAHIAVTHVGPVAATAADAETEDDHQCNDTSCYYTSYPPRRQQQICTAQHKPY